MRPARGFTLLETLVALTVLSVVLATVYNLFSSGLRGLSRDDERLTLALIAENLMARSGLDLLGGSGEASGTTTEGVRWQVTRTPFNPPPELPAPPDPAEDQAADDQAADDAASARPPADSPSAPSAAAAAATSSSLRQGGLSSPSEPRANEPAASRLRLWRVEVVVESERGERFALATWRAERMPAS